MKTVLGIDEAGRGAVLGPLVVAGVLLEENNKVLKALQAGGVRDSKVLSSSQRETAAKTILKNKIRHMTVKITPAKIDKNSINELEIKNSSKIIEKLKPDIAWLDVPASGKGVERYCRAVRSSIRHTCQVKGGNKLDNTNVAVAAASVIAKQEREKAVRKLHKIYGNFGSGYPSDPKTKKWLQENKRDFWPEIVRTKWATLARI